MGGSRIGAGQRGPGGRCAGRWVGHVAGILVSEGQKPVNATAGRSQSFLVI